MSADIKQADTVDQQKVIGATEQAVTKQEQEQNRAAGDFSQTKSKDRLTMKVKVYSPVRDYYDGSAFSISAHNATGPFDVLPRHHSFISLLSNSELVIRPTVGPEQKITISGGLMHVKADQVIVFLDV